MSFWDRVQVGWNAFKNNRDPTIRYQDIGPGYSIRPDRPRLTRGNERSIVTAIYNRIALDAASITIKHCRLDDNGRFNEVIDSELNRCLNLEANVDQSGRAFLHDLYLSMLDEGKIAMVPVDTDKDPDDSESYKILSMRTGKILEWHPRHIKVKVYNDIIGEKKDIIVKKTSVGIVENPFHAVMNEYSSTMQRLIRKINLLDTIDEKSGSGKLDLILQMPYVVKSDLRRQQAKDRLKEIEDQLRGPYGIAYTDGTERITQLNRPVENNLLKQIEYLTSMLFSQLGITQSILDGTADEKTMLNYYDRTVEPIVAAVVDEMERKFLSKTARSQRQSILYFRDPFKLVPVGELAEMADKFTRNEIMTSNEIRQIVGLTPSEDPQADELRNSNISHPAEEEQQSAEVTEDLDEGGKNQNGDV